MPIPQLIDQGSGEIFVALSLSEWERIVRHARAYEPCQMPLPCPAPACQLAAAVLACADQPTTPLGELRAPVQTLDSVPGAPQERVSEP